MREELYYTRLLERLGHDTREVYMVKNFKAIAQKIHWLQAEVDSLPVTSDVDKIRQGNMASGLKAIIELMEDTSNRILHSEYGL